MGLVETMRCLRVSVVVVGFALAGCASGAGLLEPKSASGVLTANRLAMPPEDALVAAANGPDQDEEMSVSQGVPTITELSSFVQPGIDPAKEAQELERGIQSSAVDPSVKWRGRLSEDGIDLANVNGVLCSSPARPNARGHSVQLACSDGRMALFKSNAQKTDARISFGNFTEKVLLD
jgi:hypothetical protein